MEEPYDLPRKESSDEHFLHLMDEIEIMAAVLEDVEGEEVADQITMWIDYMIYRALYADEEHASDTLTCIRNTRNVSITDLLAAVRKEGMLFSNGYGDLKEKAFRIAHLGETTPGDIEGLLSVIDRHLGISS